MTDKIDLREIERWISHVPEQEDRDRFNALVAAVRAARALFDGGIIHVDGAGSITTVKGDFMERVFRSAYTPFADGEADRE